MAKKIFLVRHGQTVGNALDLAQGHTDSALTQKGLLQAQALGKALSKEKIDLAFCSDLGRVMQTFENTALDVPAIFDSRLRECYYGKHENKPHKSLSREEGRFFTDPDAPADGGESMRNVQDRIGGVFDEIAANEKETIAIFTHHNPIVTLLCRVSKAPLENWHVFRCGNASITKLVFQDGIWRIGKTNDRNHLEGI